MYHIVLLVVRSCGHLCHLSLHIISSHDLMMLRHLSGYFSHGDNYPGLCTYQGFEECPDIDIYG